MLVVDSHRPLHLANVADDNQRVLCLLDGREAVLGGGEAGEAPPAHPAEEGEEEEEEEGEEAQGASPRARLARPSPAHPPRARR